MTTKSKNEASPSDIFEMYEQLGVTSVTKEHLVIDHTVHRERNVRFYISLLLVLPLLMALFSYNKQNLINFIGTVLFTLLVFVYFKYKYVVWHKRITLHPTEGTISYVRHFPKTHLVLQYADIDILSNKLLIKNYSTTRYYLCKKGLGLKKGKKHALLTGYVYAEDSDKAYFIKLLKQLMEEGTLPEGLAQY